MHRRNAAICTALNPAQTGAGRGGISPLRFDNGEYADLPLIINGLTMGCLI